MGGREQRPCSAFCRHQPRQTAFPAGAGPCRPYWPLWHAWLWGALSPPASSPRVAPRCPLAGRWESCNPAPHPARRCGPCTPRPPPPPKLFPRKIQRKGKELGGGTSRRGHPAPHQLWDSRGVGKTPTSSPFSPDPRREHRGEHLFPSLSCKHHHNPQLQPCPPPIRVRPPTHPPFPAPGASAPPGRTPHAPARSVPPLLCGAPRLPPGFSHADSFFHTSQTKANGGIASPCQHTRSLARKMGGGGERVGTARAAPPGVGGAVASTGDCSGPGITRGNLERVLHRIPLKSISFPKLWVWLFSGSLIATHVAHNQALPTRDLVAVGLRGGSA